MGLWEIIMGEQPGFIKSFLNYENTGQFGEYSTEYALTNNNLDGHLVVLKNIYIPYNGKTTEIDLLMIHEKGIFVFESKNFSGWIFGNDDQLYWTQSFQNGEKYKFYNPIRQNKSHISVLSKFLALPESAFTSYIVFSERCSLKKVPENASDVVIVRRPNMLRELRAFLAYAPTKYSYAEIMAIADKLKPLTNKEPGEKQQHINTIKTTCPFCGNHLVLRSGKYGKFWGCSTYPKCRFTRPDK